MTTSRSQYAPLVRIALGLGGGFVFGCVLSTGPLDEDECGDPGTHSEVEDDECVCEGGYGWCDDDEDNFECCKLDPGNCPDPNSYFYEDDGLCYCNEGFTWCDPDDVNDLSCCEGDGDDGGKGTDDTGTGGDECPDMATPDPDDCTTDTEGYVFCSNVAEDGPNCSVYYECSAGEWVENNALGDTFCTMDGYDFAFGCVDTGSAVEFVCGTGPGTSCSASEESFCQSDDLIHSCVFGRLTEDSCARICQEVGDADGIKYDTGFCLETEDTAECACCDFEEPGCGGDGDSGGTDTDTDTGTGTDTGT